MKPWLKPFFVFSLLLAFFRGVIRNQPRSPGWCEMDFPFPPSTLGGMWCQVCAGKATERGCGRRGAQTTRLGATGIYPVPISIGYIYICMCYMCKYGVCVYVCMHICIHTYIDVQSHSYHGHLPQILVEPMLLAKCQALTLAIEDALLEFAPPCSWLARSSSATFASTWWYLPLRCHAVTYLKIETSCLSQHV